MLEWCIILLFMIFYLVIFILGLLKQFEWTTILIAFVTKEYFDKEIDLAEKYYEEYIANKPMRRLTYKLVRKIDLHYMRKYLNWKNRVSENEKE